MTAYINLKSQTVFIKEAGVTLHIEFINERQILATDSLDGFWQIDRKLETVEEPNGESYDADLIVKRNK